MARNAEKAMTILARWRAVHVEKIVLDKKPDRVCECKDLKKALHFRRKVINDIATKVTEIQNAGLDDFKLRDLNDEINELLRERRRWEDQIILLGGPNHRILDAKKVGGTDVYTIRGYTYFGAARFLPGVKELLEKPAEPPVPKLRTHSMRNIEYFGLRDEDDGVILPLEEEAERERIREKLSQYNVDMSTSEGGRKEVSVDDLIQLSAEYDRSEIDVIPEPVAEVPSQAEVERALIERRKEDLLKKYASDLLIEQADETKRMLGRDD